MNCLQCEEVINNKLFIKTCHNQCKVCEKYLCKECLFCEEHYNKERIEVLFNEKYYEIGLSLELEKENAKKPYHMRLFIGSRDNLFNQLNRLQVAQGFMVFHISDISSELEKLDNDTKLVTYRRFDPYTIKLICEYFY